MQRDDLSRLLDKLSVSDQKIVWWHCKMLQIRILWKRLSISNVLHLQVRKMIARALLCFLIFYSMAAVILFTLFLAGHPLLLATGVGLLASTYILGALVDRLVLVLVGYQPY